MPDFKIYRRYPDVNYFRDVTIIAAASVDSLIRRLEEGEGWPNGTPLRDGEIILAQSIDQGSPINPIRVTLAKAKFVRVQAL